MTATSIMKGLRPASLSMGDDVTLTRMVRVDEGSPRKHRRQPRLPGMENLHIQEGRTKFGHSVKHPSAIPNLLVSGYNNIKIGRDVRKGSLRGYHIYTLTLEERATCPRSCQHWQTCYGNNMPFAKRIDHTAPEFLPKLEAEITKLCSNPRKAGILIRLHALGDFYSTEYVNFWRRMLREHPKLAIYGYTAHDWLSDIGWEVRKMHNAYGKRAMIRFSNSDRLTMATASIGDESSRPANTFVCPEQTGKTRCCATCGACWSTVRNVAFMEH